MQPPKLSDNWLFNQHAKQTISYWLQHLTYFYFVRAWGGHANDGDTFKATFRYTDRQDLIRQLGQLGIRLTTLPDDLPKPVIGQPYSSPEFKQFKTSIRNYPDLEQPGHTSLFGHRVFIWVTDALIDISVSGTQGNNLYDVTDADFNVCLALERVFDQLNWYDNLDRTLEKNVCCLSKTLYPELYE